MERENKSVGFRTLWGYLCEVGRELKRPSAWFFIIIALVLATKALEVIRTHRGQSPIFGEIFKPILRALGGFMADPDGIDRYLRRVPAIFYQIVLPFAALWFWFVISGWKAAGGRLGKSLASGFSTAWNGFGLSFDCLKHWWKILLLIFCIMLPFIYAFGTTPSFRKNYPYLQRLRSERMQMVNLERKLETQQKLVSSLAAAVPEKETAPAGETASSPLAKAQADLGQLEAQSRSLFWGTLVILLLFEAVRMLYMISWEFFFRGFMLHGMLRMGLGWHAVWIQMLPYVMLHSTKPSIELYYTIPSGVLLGVLAWKAKSIWPGFLLHFVGAVVFDFVAMFA
jgi:hypothetical protein